MQQYKLIEYIKLDGVVVTVEDAAAYLGTSISTIVYRAMNFTKSMYEGHVIERCEISADKASKLVKPSLDEAILNEKSQTTGKDKTMTLRECLKEENKETVKHDGRSRPVIREQDGNRYETTNEAAVECGISQSVMSAKLNHGKKRYIDPKTNYSYVMEENFTGIKPKMEYEGRDYWVARYGKLIFVSLPAICRYYNLQMKENDNWSTCMVRNSFVTTGEWEAPNGDVLEGVTCNDSNTRKILKALPEDYDGRTIFSLPDGTTYKDSKTAAETFGIHPATFSQRMIKNGKVEVETDDGKVTLINVSKFIEDVFENKSNTPDVKLKSEENVKVEKEITEKVKEEVTQKIETTITNIKPNRNTYVTSTNFTVEKAIQSILHNLIDRNKLQSAQDLISAYEEVKQTENFN